jgi:hypothetical protein
MLGAHEIMHRQLLNLQCFVVFKQPVAMHFFVVYRGWAKGHVACKLA